MYEPWVKFVVNLKKKKNQYFVNREVHELQWPK